MVLYAGFDIGIKNLAFCVIDSQRWSSYQKGESNDPGIVEWQNLDLIGIKKCCAQIKSGSNCNKKASWKDSNCYYCGTHKPKINVDCLQHCGQQLKSGKRHGQYCHKKALWKDEHTGNYYCGTHKSASSNIINQPNNCKPFKEKKVSSLSIDKIMEMTFTALDKFPILKDVNHIVIELQPRINPRMRTISNSIYAYLVLRCRIDVPEANLKTIRYQGAKHKLRVYKGKTVKCHLKDPKGRRKFLAKEHTKALLKNSAEVLDKYYYSYKKRDDLADAFLHCVFAVNKRAGG